MAEAVKQGAWCKQACAGFRREAWTVVPYPEAEHTVRTVRSSQFHTRRTLSIVEGIAQKVSPHLFDPGSVPESIWPVLRNVELSLLFSDPVTQASLNICHNLGHLHNSAQRFSLVHLGEEQETFNHVSHLISGGLHVQQVFPAFLVGQVREILDQVCVQDQNGQWLFQSVGEFLPPPFGASARLRNETAAQRERDGFRAAGNP